MGARDKTVEPTPGYILRWKQVMFCLLKTYYFIFLIAWSLRYNHQMLVHEIAAVEEADYVANIGKHMVSRKTTISPLWTTRSYRTLSWFGIRTNDEKHHVPSNTQYTGAIHWPNHNEQQWQFNGIKEISKKYPRTSEYIERAEEVKAPWCLICSKTRTWSVLLFGDVWQEYKIHLTNRPHTAVHSYAYTHFNFSDKTEKFSGQMWGLPKGEGWRGGGRGGRVPVHKDFVA